MTFEELGQELRKARLAKNWRPKDIVRTTKIQYQYIKKLEAGEFDFMPDPVIRGFIKSYARDVDLDQEEIIRKYEQAKAEVKEQLEQTPETEKPKSKAKKPKKEKTERPEEIPETAEKKKEPGKSQSIFQTYRGEIILGTLLVLILAGIVYIYLQFGGDYFSSEEKPVEKITVFEARKENLEEESRKPKTEPETPTQETVDLRIVAAETTWTRMIIDNKDTTEYIFYPGNERSFEAKETMEMRAGRADGLLLWINQDSVGTLGSAAEIVDRLIIGPNGIIDKAIRRPRPVSPPDTSAAQSESD